VNLFGRGEDASFTAANSKDRSTDRLQVETGTTVKALDCPPIGTWIAQNNTFSNHSDATEIFAWEEGLVGAGNRFKVPVT
jgi:hypothetical protein